MKQSTLTTKIMTAVLVLGETSSFSVSSQVVVAETVIVGDVPNTFIQAGGASAAEQLFP